MATVIRNCSCPACGYELAEVREGKSGATSIYCPSGPGCGFQGMAKSPKASAALRAGGGGKPAAEPAAAPGAAPSAPARPGGDAFKKFIDGG